ncbi:MAG: type IV pili methyl-accepting chemotaxis transducer N-terminal domain-containing protein [Pseudomonadota bacterium]
MIHRLALAAPLAAVLAFSTGQGAQATDAATAKRHVNLAALQPMLAEQIAKAACFTRLGVHPDAQMKYLRGAQTLFSKTQAGLRDGSPALGLATETHPNLIQGLDAFDREAGRWLAQTKALANGEGNISDQAFEALVLQTTKAVALTEDFAERARRTYGATDGVALSLTLRIELASRQRLLSQRIAKEFCLIASGRGGDENRAALAEAAAVFDKSMNALIDGVDAFGLPAESDTDRLRKLEGVREAWSSMQPVVMAVAAGATPDAAAIAEVAWSNNVILTQANAAVFAYETTGVEG